MLGKHFSEGRSCFLSRQSLLCFLLLLLPSLSPSFHSDPLVESGGGGDSNVNEEK